VTFAPKHAFVPAAGLGTRMRHLSAALPKPLIEVAGRSLLDRVLDRIAAAGISHAVVNVHYLADQIETALARRTTPRITISDERAELLDTGGGVVVALPALGPEPFLIHNSDSIWIEDGERAALAALFEAWDGHAMDCLMLLADIPTSIGYDGQGDFTIDDDGRLARRVSGSSDACVFTGVSIAAPRLFDGSPDGAFSLNLVWDRAIATGRLFGLRLDGRWMHVGTPEAVTEAGALLAAAALDRQRG
jgi:N-acetyl-alpha-D-muramate 1-phosphate uridylyltransferase